MVIYDWALQPPLDQEPIEQSGLIYYGSVRFSFPSAVAPLRISTHPIKSSRPIQKPLLAWAARRRSPSLAFPVPRTPGSAIHGPVRYFFQYPPHQGGPRFALSGTCTQILVTCTNFSLLPAEPGAGCTVAPWADGDCGESCCSHPPPGPRSFLTFQSL